MWIIEKKLWIIEKKLSDQCDVNCKVSNDRAGVINWYTCTDHSYTHIQRESPFSYIRRIFKVFAHALDVSSFYQPCFRIKIFQNYFCTSNQNLWCSSISEMQDILPYAYMYMHQCQNVERYFLWWINHPL